MRETVAAAAAVQRDVRQVRGSRAEADAAASTQRRNKRRLTAYAVDLMQAVALHKSSICSDLLVTAAQMLLQTASKRTAAAGFARNE